MLTESALLSELSEIDVVILAGGRGTRMQPLTHEMPKPMIDIGSEPLLSHLLKHLGATGFRRFLVASGYLGEAISEFAQALTETRREPLSQVSLRVVDTGLDTPTGGRLRRMRKYLRGDTFLLTWADGLADIPMLDLISWHRRHGRLATVVAVRPPARFGYLAIEDDQVVRFEEKPKHGPGWINGGYFVLEPEALDRIHDDGETWEHGAMVRLAASGELMAYRHSGFWQCMDTPDERALLNGLWRSGKAPWKNWTT